MSSTKYTLLVLDLGGSLAPRSHQAAKLMETSGHPVEVVRVRPQDRYDHPLTRSTGFYLFPQLLYRGQFLGSFEVVEEWCRTLGERRTVPRPLPRMPRASVTASKRTSSVWSVASDGHQVAQACADGVLEVWDGDLGSVESVELADSWLTTVRALGKGTFVAGSSRGSVRVVNTSAGVVASIGTAHKGWVNAIGVDHETQTIITGGTDHRIRLWDTPSLALRHEIEIPPAWVNAIAARNGVFWAALSSGEIIGGDITTTSTRRARVGRCLNSIDMDSAGTIATTGFDQVPVLVTPRTNAVEFLDGERHTGGVWGVRLSSTGQVVTAGSDGAVRAWSTSGGGSCVVHQTLSPITAMTVATINGEERAIVAPRGQLPVYVPLTYSDVDAARGAVGAHQ